MDRIIKGDLYQAGRSPAEVTMALSNLLKEVMPRSKFTVVSRTTSTSWTLTIGILEHHTDLAKKVDRDALEEALRECAQRFILDKSVPQADHVERTFDLRIDVHIDYWSKRQAKTLSPNFKPLSPGAFAKALTVGDRLCNRSANLEYVVLSKSPGRYTTDNGRGSGMQLWNMPRAAALKVNGDVIRIAQGTTRDPDAHLLLEWIKT